MRLSTRDPRTGAGEQVEPAAVVGQAAAAAQLALEDVEDGAPHHLHHRPRRVALRRQQPPPCTCTPVIVRSLCGALQDSQWP